ncbi:MAG TPA: RNA polymerase factor sigma-54, partial [Dokdonella sp.]|nr:RNA polymerase factor sigma-54 [Dokdonella sp.]
MKPALQLRVQSQLALTPQLQQAIRLLQLSSMELELELNLALESNPLLDLDEAGGEADEPVELLAPDEIPLASSIDAPSEAADATPDFDDAPLDLGLDRADYRTATDEDGFEPQDAAAEDLRDHLLWQLNLTPLSPADRAIGAAIIEAISDDGYLSETNEALVQSLAGLHAVTPDQVEAMRHRIQCFDPLGVASRTLTECLGVQLDALVEAGQ